MPEVIVCTHESHVYSFDEPGEARGWAQRGPIEMPQENIDAYEDALKAARVASRRINALLGAADLD